MKFNNNPLIKNMQHMFKDISIILLLVFSLTIKAQPPCGTNPAANDFCASATPICNLNGYCGNTSSTYTNWVSTSNQSNETNTPLGSVFCATIQNNSWVKFIANSTSAVFSVWASNCAYGHGIQMQIYTTNDCYNFTAVSNCWNPKTPTNGQITATGLIPGQVYYFMIDGTDGDNCDYVIAANSGVTTAPVISPDQKICKGGTANITVVGGNSYVWSSSPNDLSLAGQTTNASVTVNPTVTTTYTATVTEIGSNTFCTNNNDVLTSTVTVNPIPVFTTVSTNEHCNSIDGTDSIIIAGNSNIYTYSWSTTPKQNTQVANNLTAGTYTVSVTDTNGCIATSTSIVTNVNYLSPVISGKSSFCTGQSTVLNAGGNYFSYLWSNGSSTKTITVSNQGTYIVTVSNGNNCLGYDTIVVTANLNPAPSITGPPFICKGQTATLDGGGGYSSYLWSTGNTNQSIGVSTQNTYMLTVTDSNGCSASANYYLKDNNGPYTTIFSQNAICSNADGIATVNATGGLGSYTYLWSNGVTVSVDTGLIAGNYSVTVSDGNCSTITSVIVNETPGPVAGFYAHPNVLTLFDSYVTSTFLDNSTGNIVSWQWDFGDTTYGSGNEISHNYTSLGNYPVTLVVIDNNNCIDSITDTIKVIDYYTIYIPNCFIQKELTGVPKNLKCIFLTVGEI